VKAPKKSILGKKERDIFNCQEVLLKAAVAKSIEMFGGAQQVFEMTVVYVKNRKQFGVPVGSF